jgi:hypothetical protein
VNRKKKFVAQIWSGHGGVEPFLVHLISDAIKCVSLLACLWIFWEIVAFLRFRHYPEPYLDALEKVHFVGTFCVLLVTSLTFVASQLVALWQKGKQA